jgi:hypothetical protein
MYMLHAHSILKPPYRNNTSKLYELKLVAFSFVLRKYFLYIFLEASDIFLVVTSLERVSHKPLAAEYDLWKREPSTVKQQTLHLTLWV